MSPRSYSPEEAAAVNDLLDTLSHHLRREIVQYFENHAPGRTATFDELVDHLDGRIPGHASERLEIELVHMHLPKLAERGWVDYDDGASEIRYLGHDAARDLLQSVLAVF